MTSLFQQISQSSNSDAWERFRLPAAELWRIADIATALKFSVEKRQLAEDGSSLVRIHDHSRVFCIAESLRPAPSPFNFQSEPYSLAFTDSPDAISELISWKDSAAIVGKFSSTPQYGSEPAVLASMLRNRAHSSWLALENNVLRAAQTLNQLDLEGEQLFLTASQAVAEVLAPDLLAVRMESPGDFWPGRPADWCWTYSASGPASVAPALTPRLQRLLYRRERSMFVDDMSTADIIVDAANLSNPFSSCFLLPLVYAAKPIGTALLFYNRKLAPLPGEVEAVELLRHELSGCLDRIQTHLRMQRLATVDGLTSLFNHRFFRDQLRTEYQRALRYENMMAVIMIDIDHFKGYNDSYGHLAGDRVLAQTAQTIRSSVRDIDFVARYGGEEFALILPEVDASGGRVVAEKIRRAVESQRFLSEEGEDVGAITISCGVTDNSHATSPDDLLSRADRALYWVKRHGRNRVHVSIADRDD